MLFVISEGRKSGSKLPHSKLTIFGGGRFAGGLGFGFAEKAFVAEFPENVKEEDAGDAEHDEAFEKAVHGGESARDDDPADTGERDDAEQNGD
jgi:hypothetical protein